MTSSTSLAHMRIAVRSLQNLKLPIAHRERVKKVEGELLKILRDLERGELKGQQQEIATTSESNIGSVLLEVAEQVRKWRTQNSPT